MPYNISKYDGSNLVTIADGTLDVTSTSISLIGRNCVNSGLAINENFVAIMQHFANSSPPPQPIIGQIWYNTTTSDLQIWNGSAWITSPFDGNTGMIKVVATPPSLLAVEILIMISDQNILAAVSHVAIPHGQLSTLVNVSGQSYALASRFPNGILPGINLASDPNGYIFNGISATANALTTSRNISLSGSISGTTAFDGSNDVTITTELPSVLNTSEGWYSNVKISSNGLVIDASVVSNSDVINALGYTPPSQIAITGDVVGNSAPTGSVFNTSLTLTSTGVTPGYYNNVTVDASGRVTAGTTDYPIPIKGIILWNDTLVPTGWATCDGSVVTTTAGTITLPNIPAIGSVVYIMRIS